MGFSPITLVIEYKDVTEFTKSSRYVALQMGSI